ncbi:MAG: hypothetical protein A2Y81_02200 [Nitrospirae bacterium RBG_13_43_8]|nr:MAG: hypothetical protein A2Y81_02200 [Nitrospirae bacterium RBG_13_43_8]
MKVLVVVPMIVIFRLDRKIQFPPLDSLIKSGNDKKKLKSSLRYLKINRIRLLADMIFKRL